MNAIELLQEAKSLVATGWTQRRSRWVHGDGTVEYCATGAITKVIEDYYPGRVVINEASQALFDAVPDDFVSEFNGMGRVVEYNDAFGRHKDDVLALFDRAINSRDGADGNG